MKRLCCVISILLPLVTGCQSGVVASPSICHARHINQTDPQAWLPDPICTPGAVKGGLPESQLCPVARTKAIRPPVEYTQNLKQRQLKEYGFPGPPSAYEEDHLIPLELGGAPTDPHNLWPQPGHSPNEKDRVEDATHAAVCAGRMSLSVAQMRIATDWITLGHDLGVTK